METVKHIKITKIEGKEGSSMPVGRWYSGYGTPAKVGDPLYLSAPIRGNHFGYFTWFRTTPVVEIEKGLGGDVIVTQNSKWRIEYL